MSRLTKTENALITRVLTARKASIEDSFSDTTTVTNLDDIRTVVREADEIDSILAKLAPKEPNAAA